LKEHPDPQYGQVVVTNLISMDKTSDTLFSVWRVFNPVSLTAGFEKYLWVVL